MKPSDNYSVKNDIPKYYKYLVQLRVEAGRRKNNAEQEIKNPRSGINESGEIQAVGEFKQLLNELLDQYYYKFDRRDDLERPDCIKSGPDTDLDKLEWNELKNIYYKISELQEKLGHTSVASREWEEDPI